MLNASVAAAAVSRTGALIYEEISEVLKGLRTSVSVAQTRNCKLILLKYRCCRNKFLGGMIE